MVDRVYKNDLPRLRAALFEMRSEFSQIEPRTDWVRLRIDPLLTHLNRLEALVRRWEAARLRGAVPMLHSDLVYLRKNVDALRMVLASERKGSLGRRKSHSPRSRLDRRHLAHTAR